MWPVIIVVLLVGVLFVGVYPTQTYLRQRDELDDRQAQFDELEATNAALDERVDDLNDPAQLELMARRDHGLVRPGEEVYAVVPPEQAAVPLPDSWPFTQLKVRLDRQVG
jgi:cell division protein FtsB